jgi:thymidylate kinase
VRSRALQRKTLIAVSGVDGAGKSSLIADLVLRLADSGVVTDVVWFRPGMGMGRLESVVRATKRVLRQSQVPAMRDVDTAASLPSRQGAIGFVWCLLVTLTYLRAVRAQLRTSGSTIICDRHLLDAIVTLRVFYQDGQSRLPVLLVRRLLPPATLTLYLKVPVEVALARKPGDTIGRAAVTAQLLRYENEAQHMALHVLDSTLPFDEVAEQAWAFVAPLVPRAAT